ncbi:MAG: hypothetical protein SVU32_04270, partial [Candidatus Nanohaloarchaea archaeon]|nr:hypothetical protein [Candidatus Nanohaloarchaea archaeon]
MGVLEKQIEKGKKTFRPLLTGKVFHWLKHWRIALVLIVLAVVLVSMISLVFGMGPFQGVDGSEPAFLKDIGPRGERTDNPLAAVVVMASV